MNPYSFGKNNPFIFSDKAKTSFNNSEEYLSIIFLCGRQRDGKEKTARDSIKEEIQKSRPTALVVFAEDFLTSLPSLNALTMEKLLASICSEIIIIAESAGSICELGCFTYDPLIAKKVLVIEDSHLAEEKSFINEGPGGILRSLSYKDRKTRILKIDFCKKDSSFYLQSIPVQKMNQIVNSFKSRICLVPDAVQIKEHTLIIKDLLWLQMAIIEAVRLCWAIEENHLLEAIAALYDAEKVEIDLGVQPSLNNENILSEITKSLTIFAENKGVLHKDEKGFVHVCISAIHAISSNPEFRSVMFEKSVIQLADFQKWRSKRFNYLVRRGIKPWDV